MNFKNKQAKTYFFKGKLNEFFVIAKTYFFKGKLNEFFVIASISNCYTRYYIQVYIDIWKIIPHLQANPY